MLETGDAPANRHQVHGCAPRSLYRYAMTYARKASALGAVLLIAAAGCSQTGGKKAVEEAAQNAGRATTPTMTVAFITHSGQGDTYWDIVRRGAEDAAAKDNINLEYAADPDGANQANLVKAATDRKVDGIAVTLSKPDAMRANVTAAVKAGIPVVALNGGMDQWKQMGVLGFFGQDETLAGKAAGEQLTKDGAKKVVCVIHEQGNVGHESRCAGVAQSFPNTQKLYVTGTDMSDVQTKITTKLQQDPQIDVVLTLGAPFAMTAIKSAAATGGRAKVATFDTSAELVSAIKDGKVTWAVDQQPYLQGYLAVDSLWLYKWNGNTIGGGYPTYTGPAFITKANVDQVEKFAQAGKR